MSAIRVKTPSYGSRGPHSDKRARPLQGEPFIVLKEPSGVYYTDQLTAAFEYAAKLCRLFPLTKRSWQGNHVLRAHGHL